MEPTPGYFVGKNTGKGLLVVGPVGCGKTHMTAAIINYIADNMPINENIAAHAGEFAKDTAPPAMRRPSSETIFTSTTSMLDEIKKTYSDNVATNDVIGKYCLAKLLILDDVGTEKMTEWSGERLFEIIDYRYTQKLPLVVTTNLTPSELKGVLGDRIYDRIREMCKLVTVTAKSQRPTA